MDNLAFAIIIIAVIILVVCVGKGQTGRFLGNSNSPFESFGDRPSHAPGYYTHNFSLTSEDPTPYPTDSHVPFSQAYFPNAREPRHAFYSSADVDPLITGQLYAHRDYTRDVYGARTSHGDKFGLSEFSSGLPGQIGVDQGPFGHEEYGGKIIGYNDGIPENWAFPSTPFRYYRPFRRDYYSVEDGGPRPYTVNMFSLTEPDHEPQIA